MRAQDHKYIDFTKIDSTCRSCRPTVPGRNRPKSTSAKSSPAIAANPRLRHWSSPVAPQRPRTVPTGRPPKATAPHYRPQASGS